MKNTLKNNYNHTPRQVSLYSLGYYLFYLKWFIELESFFHHSSILLYIKLGPYSFNCLYIYIYI
jgi:hypothetical protein